MNECIVWLTELCVTTHGVIVLTLIVPYATIPCVSVVFVWCCVVTLSGYVPCDYGICEITVVPSAIVTLFFMWLQCETSPSVIGMYFVPCDYSLCVCTTPYCTICDCNVFCIVWLFLMCLYYTWLYLCDCNVFLYCVIITYMFVLQLAVPYVILLWVITGYAILCFVNV